MNLIAHKQQQEHIDAQPTMKDILGDAMNFAANSAKIIENATVYTTRLFDTGSRYETRYYGKDKALVEKYAADRMAGVDSMRSPSLSCFGKAQPMDCNGPAPEGYDGYYYVDLKYYGLD